MKWIILLLLYSTTAYGQKQDTVLKYLDASLNFTSKKNAVYTGAAIKQDQGWYFYALYPGGSYLLKAYYKDKPLTLKEGPYEMYFPKNQLALAGFYHHNILTGVVRTWYENQQLKDSGFLYYGIHMGVWKSWYANGRLKEESTFKMDSAAQLPAVQEELARLLSTAAAVKEGAYRSWYENGMPEATGTFVNDRMDSIWHWYHENGNQSSVETYKNGVITALQCYDSAGTDLGVMCSISKPPLLRQYGDYRTYIEQNLQWPKEALKKGIEDDVKVTFRVTKQGRLEDLVIQTDKPVLQKAVADFFADMTDWLPAVSHNRAIDSDEEITIPFHR